MAVIRGKGIADSLRGTEDNDKLFGLGGHDTLIGLAGDDFLVGGAGGDVMRGGKGRDTYRVDNKNDVVDEGTGALGGVDKVLSSVSFTLGNAVENLTLTGGGSINAIGNDIDNILNGNRGDNRILGKDGNDVLKGGGGEDLLVGGKGADSLRGGGGDDIFRFKDEDGFFNNVASFDWDDIVYGYVDGEDVFDVSRARGSAVDLTFYSSAGVSPNGLVGTEVAYGDVGGGASGLFFVVGYGIGQHSNSDFTGVVTIDQTFIV